MHHVVVHGGNSQRHILVATFLAHFPARYLVTSIVLEHTLWLKDDSMDALCVLIGSRFMIDTIVIRNERASSSSSHQKKNEPPVTVNTCLQISRYTMAHFIDAITGRSMERLSLLGGKGREEHGSTQLFAWMAHALQHNNHLKKRRGGRSRTSIFVQHSTSE